MASSSGGRRPLRPQTLRGPGEFIFDSEAVPSSLVGISPILRVANEVEASNPRVAYLCRSYAYQKACRQDPASGGRGVRKFKTTLKLMLGREYDIALKAKVNRTDAQEMQSFYQHYYRKYIQALQNVVDRPQLTQAYQTAAVLFEVLKDVNASLSIEVDEAILETHNQLEEKKRLYLPYNILPLDRDSANQTIMRYPEIQAAFHALRNTRGLPWPKEHQKMPDADLLDWLQATFGFQKDSVSNQREHIILLLAGVHTRQNPKPDQQPKLDDRALDTVIKKLFKNYKTWCKFLGRKTSLWLPTIPQGVQQRKLLYVGLYLLIWGEAANLRFMPECICYIYHHMAFELYGILAGNVILTTGENVKPAYGGEEAFLNKVVTPIYKVIEQEANMGNRYKSSHSNWRNYDDLNEYFWSSDCFRLEWPMRADADFFQTPYNPRFRDTVNEDNKHHWMGKVNFAEIRSFWHIFHSFDRMWSFLILSLQAMIIIARNGGRPSDIFDAGVLKHILTIFTTSAILKLCQSILDVVLTWKARRSMAPVKLRYILKLLSAAAWVIILTVTYAYIWENPTGPARTIKKWFGDGRNHPTLYIYAVVIYLAPNMLAATLFLFPELRRFLENSNIRVIRLIMWWSESRLCVGKGMHVGRLSVFKYTMFWVFLLATKLVVSYYMEIKPLVQLTEHIMRGPRKTFESHEFFPHANNEVGVIIALWAPVILVYFMDTQIWYTIFSTLIGGIYGAFDRLGEIRTLEMLRSRFESLPFAFSQMLFPSESNKTRGAACSAKPSETAEDGKEEKIAARFAQTWNLIITSFRKEDLINNREMDLLRVPYYKDREMDIIQWPPFLLASKIPIALDMAADSSGHDRDLKKRMKFHPYFTYAIKECYASVKSIIYTLVVGEYERALIEKIFAAMDNHITQGTVIRELNMAGLPAISSNFVDLLILLKNNKEEDQGHVIILFQDMLEVLIRDIMDGEPTV